MAGFCRNCGAPLDDVQAFCGKCGTAAAGPPVRPSASASAAPPSAPPASRPPAAPQARPQSAAPAPQAAAVSAPAAASKSGGVFIKILLIFVAIIFIFGAVGIAGIWYVAHRVKQKVHEIGLDDLSNANASRGPALSVADACSLLSKDDVAQVVKMEVVRAEPAEGSDPGCQYSVMGDYVDLIAKHAALLQTEQATDAQRQTIESFAKSIGQSTNPQQNNSAHPGESPVFIFSVGNSAAKAQMSMTRAMFGRMAPAFTELPGIGDEAFDVGSAMILARKGEKIVRIMYMMCPCTRDDAVPLARKIAANM